MANEGYYVRQKRIVEEGVSEEEKLLLNEIDAIASKFRNNLPAQFFIRTTCSIEVTNHLMHRLYPERKYFAAKVADTSFLSIATA